MSKNKFSPIPSIIRDAKKGKMFILVDDKNRENEGDLVVPGSKCNSKIINFMAKHGRGLICLALSKRQIDKLKLPLMSLINKSGISIFIDVKREILHERISRNDKRPLLNGTLSLDMKLSDLYKERINYYKKSKYHISKDIRNEVLSIINSYS